MRFSSVVSCLENLYDTANHKLIMSDADQVRIDSSFQALIYSIALSYSSLTLSSTPPHASMIIRSTLLRRRDSRRVSTKMIHAVDALRQLFKFVKKRKMIKFLREEG